MENQDARTSLLWLGLRLARAGVLLFISASLSGCGYVLGGASHVSGAELPPVIPHFAPNAPEEQVVAALGAPSSRQTVGGDERLTWSEVRRPRGCRIYLFGFIPMNREPRMTRDVVVTVRQGVVQQAVLRSRDRQARPTSNPSSTHLASPSTRWDRWLPAGPVYPGLKVGFAFHAPESSPWDRWRLAGSFFFFSQWPPLRPLRSRTASAAAAVGRLRT